MSWINDTNLSLSNNLLTTTMEINTATDGFFMLAILITTWIIAFMIFSPQGTQQGLLTASVLTVILAIGFWSIQLIGWSILMIVIAITVAAFFTTVWKNKS